jgi:hypothetical protein
MAFEAGEAAVDGPAGVAVIKTSAATTAPPMVRKSRLEYFFFVAISLLSAFLLFDMGLLLA